MRKYLLSIKNKEYKAELKELKTNSATIEVNGEEYKVNIKDIERKTNIMPAMSPSGGVSQAPAAPTAKAPQAPAAASSAPATPSGNGQKITAPLPGLILSIAAPENTAVNANDCILVMEAMKMENQVQSPINGTVTKIFVNKGDSVAEGDLLAEVSPS